MKHQKLSTTPEISKRMANVHLKSSKAENDLAKALWEKGIIVRYTDDVPAFIAEKAFSAKYGARNMRRFISREIEDMAAEKIISGYERNISEINIRVNDDKFEIDVK